MRQLLKEVEGKTAEKLLASIESGTEKGWRLVNNHLKLTTLDRAGKIVSYDSVACNKGPEKPVILNDGKEFCVMTAKQIKDCPDCPHPCV